MFRATWQPTTISEVAQIYAWRLMLAATRVLLRIKTRWLPVVVPILPFMWVPITALVMGTLLGWILKLIF